MSSTPKQHINFATPENQAFYEAGIYQSLNPDRREIRLVRIYAGSDDEPLVCELIQNVPLDLEYNAEASNQVLQARERSSQSPPGLLYWALSYVAGSPKETETIQLEGQAFNVFRNLGVAMRRIRHSRLPYQVFIDQICINQSDVSERGEQVAMMGKIYEGCHGCLAWLGTDEMGEEDLAREGLEHLAHNGKGYMSDSQYANYFTDVWDMAYQNHENFPITELSWNLLLDDRTDTMLAAVCRLFVVEWFNRCWCYQEMVLAPRAIFLFGKTQILRETVARGASILDVWASILERKFKQVVGVDHHHFADEDNKLTPHEAQLLKRIRLTMRSKVAMPYFSLFRHCQNNQRIDLAFALYCSSGGRSTDPRDRIYSLLGLLEKESVLVPSYNPSNTVGTVLKDAVQAILLEQRWLDLLTLCLGQGRGADPDISTWMPDIWSPRNQLHFFNLGTRCSRYNLCQKRDLIVPPGSLDTASYPKVFTDKGSKTRHVLDICAILLDNVGLHNTVGELGASFKSQEQTFRAWLDHMAVVGITEFYSVTGEPVAQALDVCVGWGIKADPGRARTHLSCNDDASSSHYNVELKHKTARQSVLGGNLQRFFITPKKYIGVGPADLRFDDIIAVVLDCNYPFIVRRLHDHLHEDAYSMVGPAYVHGLDIGSILEKAHPIEQRCDVVRIRLY